MKFSMFFKGIVGLCFGFCTTQTYAQYITMKSTCNGASKKYELEVNAKAGGYATVFCETYRASYNIANSKDFYAPAVYNTIFLNNFGSGKFILNLSHEANGVSPISTDTLFFAHSSCSIMGFDAWGYYYEYFDYGSSFVHCT